MSRVGARQRVRDLWHGRDVALIYGIIVVVISVVVAAQDTRLADDLVNASSTNLVNLRERPFSVLFASPFVVSPATGLWLVPPMVVAYGALERWLGRGSLIVVAVLGHVGATLVVATIEVTSTARRFAAFSVGVSPDVGISYGLAAVVGVLVLRVRPAWRRRYLLASLAVVAGQVAIVRDFTSLGHVVAWLIGLALAVPISRAAGGQPTPET